MKEKTTDDLKRELMSEADPDAYIKENEALFVDKTVIELLGELYERKSLSKAALAKQAGMSEVYVHQVFSGRRTPSRDRLLCLCIGLEATLEETQRLFEAGHLCPALSRQQAGRHHHPRHYPPHQPVPNQ